MLANDFGSFPSMPPVIPGKNLPTGQGKSAARMAAVVAAILAVLFILFNFWPLSEEMGKVIAKLADKQKTYIMITAGIYVVECLLGLYLSKCIISMTGNTAGRWAGTLISVVMSVGVIYYGAAFSYALTGTASTQSTFFNTEGFLVAFNVGYGLFHLIAGFLFINALRGAARSLLMLGYFLFGFMHTAAFLLITYGDMGYKDRHTATMIYSIISIIALIIIVAGYCANLRTGYQGADDGATRQQPYAQPPQYYQPQYQQPQYQQPQYQQPRYQQPRQPYAQPPQHPQHPNGGPTPPPVPPV